MLNLLYHPEFLNLHSNFFTFIHDVVHFNSDKELHVCFSKGQCEDPRDGWYQGQIGFLDKYVLPLAKRSQIYFEKEFSDAIVNNGLMNMQLWMKYGIRASAVMLEGIVNDTNESEVLLQLYELPSL